MWFGTRQQLAKLNLHNLANKFPTYTFSSTARDLGVLLNWELTFVLHLHRLSQITITYSGNSALLHIP